MTVAMIPTDPEGASGPAAHGEGNGVRGQASPRRSKWLWTAAVAALGLLTVVVLGFGFGRDPSVVGSPLIGNPAPPLAGETLDGESFDLADHRGDVLLVNVWASWCPPCVEEFPVLADATRRLGPHGLHVVGINSQDRDEDAREFIADMDAEGLFPHVRDPRGEASVEWGVFGLPETFLVDRDGTVRAKVVGLLTYDWIVDEVIPLLEEQ